eukprot:1061487-Pleurochrysis_carterae.AAC.2
MSAAGAAHLKNQLEESQAAFAAYGRMSTDINALIRAVYKELHHRGAYAKGKGRREFIPWLLKHHHALTPYIPLERAPTAEDRTLPSTGRCLFSSVASSLSSFSRRLHSSSNTPTSWRTSFGWFLAARR